MSQNYPKQQNEEPIFNPLTVRQIKIESARPYVRFWLYSVAFTIFIMVLVGGATRLTDSGLSITEWKPLLGAIPPLNEADWLIAFEKYKQIPEFKVQNFYMKLADFKYIFWWEWGHRFLGRFIGVLFFIPLMFFIFTNRLENNQALKLFGIFILGGLQGFMGWYMVKSGLVERVDVSQYRLAAHLTLAFVIYALVLWAAFGVGPKNENVLRASADKVLVRSAEFLILLIIVQVAMGGFVAGIDAGMGFNTWPKMEGKLIPDGLLYTQPWYINFTENALTIQFTHRCLAYILALYAVFHMYLSISRAATAKSCIWSVIVVGVVMLQMGLGIWTLLAKVPLNLALAHQAGALILLSVVLYQLHHLSRVR